MNVAPTCVHCPQKAEEGVGASSYFSVSMIKHYDQGNLKKNLSGLTIPGR